MDPALEELRAAYARGDVVLFAGAGVSAAAGLPGWATLITKLTARARASGVASPVLDEITALAGRYQLIDALSALKYSLGPAEFGAAVEQLLDDASVTKLPDIAVAIAGLGGLRAVITTNLDHLLERAFAGAWPPFARVPGNLAQRRRFILKLHGTLMDRSTWVFTRDEYDRAMHADELAKQAFGAFFNACTLLFVGYGLTDDDLDAVLARVRATAGDQPPRHFALVASSAVTGFRRETLQKAGVRLITYDNADRKHNGAIQILRELGGSAVTATSATTGVGATPPETAVAPRIATAAAPTPPGLLLPRAEIGEIHTTALHLGLARSRGVLLGGLDPTVSASLPDVSDPSGQMLQDLHTLNAMERLRDGTSPLALWLSNALQLTRARPESDVFRRALAVIEPR